MSENQYSVDELVVKLHLNIDNINQIVHSISHENYNQELDQLTAERESAIHSLREKRVEALKEILAQRSREKEETENKRLRERKLIEEKRVQEWEEILARRRREDEEWQKTIDIEDEITEKSRSAEDEEREREREEEERVFFEKSEEELDKLEKKLEEKLEERKIELKKLNEERKIINAQIEATLSAISVIPDIVFRSRRSRKGTVSHDDSHEELNENPGVVTPVLVPETSEFHLEPKVPEDYHPPVFRAHSKSLPHIRVPKIGIDFSFLPNHKKSSSDIKISRYTPLLTSSEPKELRLVAIIQKEMTEQAMKKNESILSQKKISKFAIQTNTHDGGTETSRGVLNNPVGSLTAILPRENHASVFKGEPLSKENLRNLDSESPFNSVHENEATILHSSPDSGEGTKTHHSTWPDTKAESKNDSDASTLNDIAFDQDESNFEISSQASEIPDPSLDQREQYNAVVKDSLHFSPVKSQEQQVSIEAVSDFEDSNQKLSSSVELHIENHPLIHERQYSMSEKDLAGQSIQSDIRTTQLEDSNEEIDVSLNTYSPKELQNSSELESHILHEKKWVSLSTVSKITEHNPENQLGKLLLNSTLASDQSLQLENEPTKGELLQSNKYLGPNQELISNTNLKSKKEPTNYNSNVPSITDVSESDIISEHADLDQSFQVSDVSVLGQDTQFQVDEEKNKDDGTNLLSKSSAVSEIHKEKLDQSLNYSHSTEDLETTNNTEIESSTQSFREIQKQDSVSQLNKFEQHNLDKISYEQISIDNQKKDLTPNIDQSPEMSFIPNDASINFGEDKLPKASVHDLTAGTEMIKSIQDAATDSSEISDRNLAVLSHNIIPIDTGEQDRFTQIEMTSSDVSTQDQIISSIKPIEASILLGRTGSADSTTANLPSGTQIVETKDNFQANFGGKLGSNETLDENKTIVLRTYNMRYRKDISRDLAALKYFNKSLISEPNHLSNAQPSTILGMPVSSCGGSNVRSSLTTSTKKSISSDIFTDNLELMQENITLENLEPQNFQNQDNFDRSTDIEGQNLCSPSQIYQNSKRSSTMEILKNEKEMYFDNSSKVESHTTATLEFETTNVEDEAKFSTPCLKFDEKKSDKAENQSNEETSEIINQESDNNIRRLSVEISEKSQDDYQSITMKAEDNNRSSYLGSIETSSSSDSSSQISSPTSEITSEQAQSYLNSKTEDSNIQKSSSDLTSDLKEKSRNDEDSNEYFKNNVNKENNYKKSPKYDEKKEENFPISSDIISELEKSSKDNSDEKYQIIKYHFNKDEHQSKQSDTPEINDNIENDLQNNIDDENLDNLSEQPMKDDNTEKSEQIQEKKSLTVSNEDRDLENNSITGGFISEISSKDLDSEISLDSPKESVNLETELETDSTQQVNFQGNNLEHQTNLSQNSLGSRNMSEEKVEDSLPISGSSDSKSTFNSYMDAVSYPVYENLPDSTILPDSNSTIIDQKNDVFQDVNQINNSSEALQPTTDWYPEIILPSSRTISLSEIESKGSIFQKARALFEYQYQQQQPKPQNDQQKKNTVRPLSGLLNRRNIYKNPQNRSMSLNSTFFSMPHVSEEEETIIPSIKTSDNNNCTHGPLLHTSSSAPPYSQSKKRSQRSEQSRISFYEQLQFASGTSPLSPQSGVLSPISCSQGS
ncbi:hypothetical protein Golomagni_03667 [Golovinomyces magnicellulatus]|nr:hypothetical protein Golomagni_03667 [Golovinomyces magnicellulatus]